MSPPNATSARIIVDPSASLSPAGLSVLVPVFDGRAADLAPHPMPSGLDPMTEVSSIVSRSRSSFTWGMRSLPKARRDAIFAVYAFCRIVDDIADCESMHADRKRALLEAWRIEIEQVYAGLPKSSIGRALLVAVDRFDLPGAEFRMMLEGMKMDVDGPIVAPAKADLLDYTRRVAGSVGALSIRIFGARDCPERDRFALTLADALQLTNILRDVEEDAQIGRVYLPRQSLATHGLPVHDPAALIADLTRGHAALPAICAEVGAMARTRFQEAREALGALEPASVRPALMMMGVYEGYLDRMEALGHARHVRALTMPRWQKLARSLRYAYAPPRRAAPISSGVMGSRP